jgi:hypothetical protein
VSGAPDLPAPPGAGAASAYDPYGSGAGAQGSVSPAYDPYGTAAAASGGSGASGYDQFGAGAGGSAASGGSGASGYGQFGAGAGSGYGGDGQFGAGPIPGPTPVDTPPKKKSKLLGAAIIAAAVVVLAAVVALGARLFLGRTVSYEAAEKNAIKAMLAGSSLLQDKGIQADFSFAFTPGDDLVDYVEDEGGDIATFETSGTVSVLADAILADMGLSIDGEELIRSVISFDGMDYTFAFPEVTDYYLTQGLSDYLDEDDLADIPDLDQKKLLATLNNILDIYFDEIKPVTTTNKNKELSGGQTKVKVDEYVIDFNEKVIYNIALRSLEEIKENSNLMEFANAYMENMGGYYDDFEDILDEAIEDIEDELDDLDDEDGERIFRMTAWVKGPMVIGRKIDKVVGDAFSGSYQVLVNGKNAHIEASGEVYYEGSMSFKGDFTKGSKGWSGKPKVSISPYYGDSYSFSVTVTDFNVKGQFVTGKAQWSDTIDDVGMDVLVTWSEKSSKQTIAVTANVETDWFEGDVGEWSLTYGWKTISKLSLPEYDEGYEIPLNALQWGSYWGYDSYDDPDQIEENIENFLDDMEDVADELYDYYDLPMDLYPPLWWLDDIIG